MKKSTKVFIDDSTSFLFLPSSSSLILFSVPEYLIKSLIPFSLIGFKISSKPFISFNGIFSLTFKFSNILCYKLYGFKATLAFFFYFIIKAKT